MTAPPVAHDPVSVVIADFRNGTADATFDRALEQTLRRGLEGAEFISAYDRSRLGTLGEQTRDTLDETAAREARRQARSQRRSRRLDRAPRQRLRRHREASGAISGNEIAAVNGRASRKEDVVDVANGSSPGCAGRLATRPPNPSSC